ncbi:hypothetical protein [Mesorhizobium marinum]|uniref:hypothetical protein n=1 Tax=Mesorhizobium marinum TaxID=3228790 RepID=UPI003467D9A3
MASAIASFRVIDPDNEPDLARPRAAIEVPALSPSDLAADVDGGASAGPRRIRHLLVLDGGRD